MTKYDRSKGKLGSKKKSPSVKSLRKGPSSKKSFSKGSSSRKRDSRDIPKKNFVSTKRREVSNKKAPKTDYRNKEKTKLELYKAVCISCNKKCEVPFNPESNRPVYCSSCFTKKENKASASDLELIHEKLDKIMRALKIR